MMLVISIASRRCTETIKTCENAAWEQVGGLPEEGARHLFQELLVAVDYCHRLGIVNRDIKLDNLMLQGSWPHPVLKVHRHFDSLLSHSVIHLLWLLPHRVYLAFSRVGLQVAVIAVVRVCSGGMQMCDFGYSKDEAGQSISKSTCGTPEYMAPEVLFEDRYVRAIAKTGPNNLRRHFGDG